MNTPHHVPAGFSVGRDLLGYTLGATPSADAWLATFTGSLMQQPTAAHATDAFMSGLRFYTPAFVAEIAALPPVESRLPPIPGRTAQAIYTATGSIVIAVYQTLIRRNGGREKIQAAFAQAVDGLLAAYHPDLSSTNGVRYLKRRPDDSDNRIASGRPSLVAPIISTPL
jgi:hypothetical protein